MITTTRKDISKLKNKGITDGGTSTKTKQTQRVSCSHNMKNLGGYNGIYCIIDCIHLIDCKENSNTFIIIMGRSIKNN